MASLAPKPPPSTPSTPRPRQRVLTGRVTKSPPRTPDNRDKSNNNHDSDNNIYNSKKPHKLVPSPSISSSATLPKTTKPIFSFPPFPPPALSSSPHTTSSPPAPDTPSRTGRNAKRKTAAATATPTRTQTQTRTPTKAAGGKYGPCPQCGAGRRVRSRFKPHGRSPFAGRFRFVCSNRAAGCSFWELLEGDPLLEDPAVFHQKGSGPGSGSGFGSGQGLGPCLGPGSDLEGKDGENGAVRAAPRKAVVCPRCGEGVLVEKGRDVFRWRERVLVCERVAEGGGGCGYREEVAGGGDGRAGAERAGDEFQAAVIARPPERQRVVVDLTGDEEMPCLAGAEEKRTTFPTAHGKAVGEMLRRDGRGPVQAAVGERRDPQPETPSRGTGDVVAIEAGAGPGSTEFDDDLNSEEERELIRLADQVMDDLNPEEELELIELADRVSASYPL